MADSIIDIVHRLSYEVEGKSELERIVENLQRQARNVDVLSRSLEKLKQRYNDLPKGETEKRAQLAGLIERQTLAIQRQTQAMTQSVAGNKQLQQVIKDEISIVGSLEKKLKDLKQARDMATSKSALQGYNKQIADVQAQLNQATSLPQQGGRFTGVGRTLLMGLGIGGGIQLAQQGIQYMQQWIGDASRLAAEMEGVKVAFDRLNRPNLLDELRTATRGTVSDLELMKNAVQFSNFGLPVEKLGTALAFARTRARETGVSVDYLVQSITTGIGRQSPLILDNLGINAKRVSQEFQKTGNFAEAAFKIIQEETAKSGKALDTYADKIDRINASIQNTQAEAGGFFNNLKQGGLALFGDAISGNIFGGGDNATMLAAAYAQKDIADEARDREVTAQKAFYAQLDQIGKDYADGDEATRQKIYNTALNYQNMLLQQAEQFYGKDTAQFNAYADEIAKSFEGLWSRFAQARGEIMNVAKPLEQQNVEQLKATMDRNQQFIDAYTKQQLSNSEDRAQRDRLLKENERAQKLIDQIQGKKDKAAASGLKSENRIADQRYELERKLQEQIAQLQDAAEDRRLQKMRDGIPKIEAINEAQRRRTLLKIDEEEEQARRKGTLSPKAEEQFAQIRILINRNTEQTILDQRLAYLKRYYDEARAIERAQLDARIAQSKLFNELHPTEQGFREQASLETEAALAENRDKYAKLIEQEAAHGGDLINVRTGVNVRILQLYREQKENELLIEEQGQRKQIEAVRTALEQRLKVIEAFGAYQIALVSEDAVEEQDAIEEQYRRGEISYRAYLKKLKRVQQEEGLQTNRANQTNLQSQIDEAEANYTSLQSNPNAVPADLQAAFTKIQQLRKELAKLREDETNTQRTIIQQRLDEIAMWADAFGNAINAIGSALNQLGQYQQASLDKEISIRERRVEEAKKLAERGNTDALRLEEERLRNAQKKREEYARREQIVNAALAMSNAIVAVAKAAAQGAGQGGYGALVTIPATIAALAAGYAFVRTLDSNTGFKKGGYTGDGNESDVAGPVHKREYVFDAKATRRIGVDNLEALRRGELVLPTVNVPAQEGISRREFDKLGKKLDTLTEAVEGSRVNVRQSMDRDGIAQAVETFSKNTRRAFS